MLAEVGPGRELGHCLLEELEVVRGHCQRPKMGRLPEEEELAAEEGTFAAAVEERPERMGCFADSTQPMLPCRDRQEELAAAH